MYKMIPIGLFVVLLLRSFSFRAFATICYWPFKPFVAVVIVIVAVVVVGRWPENC